MKNLLIIIIPAFFLVSCFEEDERVEPHESGDVQTAMVGMTQNYSEGIFFDLGTGTSVLETGKFAWDLAFESQANGWRIFLNTTRFMMAAPAGTTSFEAVTDTLGLRWGFDKSDGNPDSTAVGEWFELKSGDSVSREEVYVVDLGYTNNGSHLGFRKFKILEHNEEAYRIAYSMLDGSEYAEAEIYKDPGMPLVFYSLREHQMAGGVWPAPGTWDLWFTQYTTLLYTNEGDPYPYIVTGVLSNYRDGVEVAVDTSAEFAGIDFDYAQGLEYTLAADRIGYDWKWYDFDAASYTVLPGISYVVRTTEGYFYKLRFIGFYNQEGEKGYPTFEFQQL